MIHHLLGALFLSTTVFPQSLNYLKLPQPPEVIIRNMESKAAVVRPPTTQSPSLFGRLLAQTQNILGVTNPSEPPEIRHTQDPSITIAIVGDSMVDTMGTGLPYLAKALRSVYPDTRLELLNYGVGSTNINAGLERLTTPLNYQDRSYPSVIDASPDLVIIESFAYNPIPLSDSSLEHHRSQLANMATTLNVHGLSRIMLLSTIAPHHTKFGTGPQGVDWEPVAVTKHTEAIHAYLENTINTGKSLSLPIIDAFHLSQDGHGNGREELINPGDFIHPSALGQQFIANTIVDSIISTRILE